MELAIQDEQVGAGRQQRRWNSQGKEEHEQSWGSGKKAANPEGNEEGLSDASHPGLKGFSLSHA